MRPLSRPWHPTLRARPYNRRSSRHLIFRFTSGRTCRLAIPLPRDASTDERGRQRTPIAITKRFVAPPFADRARSKKPANLFLRSSYRLSSTITASSSRVNYPSGDCPCGDNVDASETKYRSAIANFAPAARPPGKLRHSPDSAEKYSAMHS